MRNEKTRERDYEKAKRDVQRAAARRIKRRRQVIAAVTTGDTAALAVALAHRDLDALDLATCVTVGRDEAVQRTKDHVVNRRDP